MTRLSEIIEVTTFSWLCLGCLAVLTSGTRYLLDFVNYIIFMYSPLGGASVHTQHIDHTVDVKVVVNDLRVIYS